MSSDGSRLMANLGPERHGREEDFPFWGPLREDFDWWKLGLGQSITWSMHPHTPKIWSFLGEFRRENKDSGKE